MSAPQNPRVRVALIGAGRIAETHLHALRGLSGPEVRAVYDLDPGKAEDFARRHRIPLHGGDWRPAARGGEFEAAHVLTSPPTHTDLSRALLEEGIHVFVEKPMGVDPGECEALAALAEREGLAFAVNHNQCHHPTFLELKAALEAGRIGRIEQVFSITNLPLRQMLQGQWAHWMFASEGNLLLEAGPHPMSMVLDLAGPPRACRALRSSPFRTPDARRIWRTWRILLDCGRISADLFLSLGRTHLDSRILVLGTDGALEADLVHGSLSVREKTPWPEFWDTRVQLRADARRFRRRGGESVRSFALALFGLAPQSDLFFRSIRASILAFHRGLRGEGRRPDAQPGVLAIRWLDRALRSAEDWGDGEVSAPPSSPKVEPAPEPPRPRAEGPPILVTGATGFVGRSLCRTLRERGLPHRVLLRSPSSSAGFEGAEVAIGDLGDRASLEAAVRGCDAVIHLATGLGTDLEETRRLAVEGTLALAESALRAGVRAFLFTSSIAALYLGGREPVPDDSPPDPRPRGRSDYARAKIEAEIGLRKLARDRGLPLAIFRPGLIVGPGGRTRHSALGFWPRDTICLGWGKGDTPLPFVLVDDVVEALLLALEREEALGRSFHLAGPVRPCAAAFVRELARRSGRPIRFLPRSTAGMMAADLFKWAVKIGAKRRWFPFPSYRDLKTRALTAPLDARAAVELLGWNPESDLEAFHHAAIDLALPEEERP